MTDEELARLKALADENTRLRAALAMSDRPCAYCSLSAEEWNKCASGFPGCARADDAVSCSEFGAALENQVLRAEIGELRAEIERLREALRFAYDTLVEINVSNYDHDDVCALNAASIEVMLGLKSLVEAEVTDD